MSRKVTRSEVAAFVRSFLTDKLKGYDWDDFVTMRCRDDPEVDMVRKYLREIYDRYPAEERGHYCNERGLSELRRMAELLESGSAIERDEHGIPRPAAIEGKQFL